MKKETKKIKNGYITTYSRSEGNYATISNNIINDSRLSDSAVRLLIMLINSPSEKISMTYYRKKLGWGSEKMSKITKKLAELGYLKGIQYPQGEKFKYHYNIDETGKLKPSYDDNGNVIVLKNSTKPYTKKEHHKKKETTKQPEPKKVEIVDNDILKYLIDNVNVDVIEMYQDEFTSIINNVDSYNQQVKDIDALIKKIKLECYNFNINNVSERLSKVSKKASTKFSEYLKKEIFEKFNLNVNATNKLKHFNQQNPNQTKQKTLFEDKLQELSEQPND
ncbi:hypothetical protein BA195_10105 [Tenacibaculum soleae]|uniref:Uncharacterized protein n=1 Tax=Tenacibaculum soleae TaxID=447689 RepID=A0A1B9XYB2_9FLAO|nr:hypothetical protein [Tenacibaculum soleae]OCK42519.1 hypothetical protein BA195_10105 [Tenacibaculum soleae]